MYNFRLDVITALKNQQYEVAVIAPDDAWSLKLTEAGIRFIPLTMDNKGTAPLRDLKLLFDLYRLYKKNKPDLIFHYTIKPNIYGSMAAAICSVKSIACVTGAGSVFLKNNFLTRLVKRLFLFSFKFPRQVWFLNPDDMKLFTRNGMVLPSKCIILPGEGIDVEAFKDIGSTPRTKDTTTFLYLGRLLWDKGIGEYIEAARNIKKIDKTVQFQILGFADPKNPSGINLKQVEDWSEEGVIEFLGASDHVKEVILDADCIVLPTYREGIPRSLLEAASLGKPVIATNVPGCREIVDHNITGLLCAPKDHQDLQAKMEKIINMPMEKRTDMGKAGREKVKAMFSLDLIIGRYSDAINKILVNEPDKS